MSSKFKNDYNFSGFLSHKQFLADTELSGFQRHFIIFLKHNLGTEKNNIP